MKLMPALPETVFDIGYLLFAVVSGILLLKKSGGKRLALLFGAMTLVLGMGDSFHLVPRILDYWTTLDMTAALGIGKLVTSVTMTVFYLLLEYARQERYRVNSKLWLCVMWALSAVRIALCCFPQNGWTSESPSLLWGIIRNVPFVMIGVLTVILWLRSAKGDRHLHLLWLYVLLSFAFYLPVVLLAHTLPMMGMLMLPKTVMYILMIVQFKKSVSQIKS